MTERAVFSSLVCCGCSCLCDDIDVVVENGRVVETMNACAWGAARFLGWKKFSVSIPRARCGTYRRLGSHRRQAIKRQEAIAECRDHLFHAQRVVVYGLSQMSVEALALLMQGLRGYQTLWIPSDGLVLEAFVNLYRRHSPPTTTLECVRNHADFVLFWGANPLRSTPRLLARYALFPRGRFTERGAEDRAGWTVDIQSTEMARVTKLLSISQDGETTFLRALHQASLGQPVGSMAGIPSKDVTALLKDLERCRYRVFFLGRGPLFHAHGAAVLEGLASWVEDLGASAPTFLLPLPTDFNSGGVLLTFLSCAGLANPLWHLQGDLHGWNPKPGDVLLALSGDCFWFLTEEQRQAVRQHRIPVLAVSAYETMTTAEADVVVSVGLQGLDASGSAVRMDGVSLYIEKLWDRDLPSDKDMMQDLFDLSP
ncbi:hypothetical protein [Desulfosoma caldarium]|uniref:Formylmethanofuran dehydrogenase subunit B n=1 Tax=Desulfosoma caldarium TaxID=610254 RepID=A0A3N1UWL4_9BACT|nr:hypothetical protein [Desulfosoma caldarium]ROQ92311.1 formylmethanofuran dehydrogenase subunit B [Desulfosoma caldarium]